MVGPPEVAEKTKAVQDAVFKHWQAHLRQNGRWGVTGNEPSRS
jgi:hypothetical protein